VSERRSFGDGGIGRAGEEEEGFGREEDY